MRASSAHIEGVLRVDPQRLLVGSDGVLVGSRVIQFARGKISLSSQDVGLGRTSGGGCGIEGRLNLAAVQLQQQPETAEDQEDQQQDAVRVGLAPDRVEIKRLAVLDLAHIRVWGSRLPPGC